MGTKVATELERFVKKLQERYPDIRPYGEDDWDWDWADEGMEFLEAGDYAHAEDLFQQLILSQPEHPDGYEGLALVYKAIGKKNEAVLLIDHAVNVAGAFQKKGYLEEGVLDAILEEQKQIHEM